MIGILDDNIVYVYSMDGTQRYAYNVGTGSKKVILTGESEACVLSANQIRRFDLNKTSTADTAINSEN